MTDVRQRGSAIGRCTWTYSTSDIYPATYAFTFYETRTGRTVRVVHIDSDLLPAEESCSGDSSYRGPIPPDRAQGVRTATLIDALRPLMTSAAR
ncbi:hypothetical protein [Amycolatopsis sp. A1MSW2902]|uniref:hypothetical protein n=1 Tax=Amycolatopsis sp. A1MSW2902 TaxID=687413 RepID=UPI00307F74C6